MSATAVNKSPSTGRLKPWQLRLYSALIPVCIAGFAWGLFGIHLYTGISPTPVPGAYSAHSSYATTFSAARDFRYWCSGVLADSAGESWASKTKAAETARWLFQLNPGVRVLILCIDVFTGALHLNQA